MLTLGDLDVIDAQTWGDVGLIREFVADQNRPGYKPGKFTRKNPSMFDEAVPRGS